MRLQGAISNTAHTFTSPANRIHTEPKLYSKVFVCSLCHFLLCLHVCRAISESCQHCRFLIHHKEAFSFQRGLIPQAYPCQIPNRAISCVFVFVNQRVTSVLGYDEGLKEVSQESRHQDGCVRPDQKILYNNTAQSDAYQIQFPVG